MSLIDRRRILTSLAGGAAIASASHAISKEAFADTESSALRERAVRHYCWVLAQQGVRTRTQHPIDFWCGPFAPIRYENYLPPQMGRGLIAYEDFPHPIDTENKAIEAFKETAKFYDRDWLDPETLDYFAVKPAVGSKDFPFIFSSLVGEKNTPARTALLAIDSPLGEFGRPGVLSAFSSCYNSMIGISHIGERGFLQQKRYSRTSSESDFVRGFLRDTSLCDTVIVTSSGLFELDAGLSPSASTEDLVGEIVRRLSYALMEPEILQRLVGGTKKSRPRYFALGSATLSAQSEPRLHLQTQSDPLLDLQTILDRQSAFVSASFAPLATDDLPLFIATSWDDDLKLREGAWGLLARAAARMGGYEISPDVFATVQAPRYQADARWPGALDLIGLWPFVL
jgi:hypothetical protein